MQSTDAQGVWCRQAVKQVAGCGYTSVSMSVCVCVSVYVSLYVCVRVCVKVNVCECVYVCVWYSAELSHPILSRICIWLFRIYL